MEQIRAQMPENDTAARVGVDDSTMIQIGDSGPIHPSGIVSDLIALRTIQQM